jgi:hypothetical protein
MKCCGEAIELQHATRRVKAMLSHPKLFELRRRTFISPSTTTLLYEVLLYYSKYTPRRVKHLE